MIGILVKTFFCACAISLIGLGSPVHANSKKAAAEYIVSQTITRSMFEGAIAAQRPMMIDAVQYQLNAKGVTLTDPDRFFDLLTEEFLSEFTQSMQEQSASVYLRNFSKQELTDIAAFFQTDSGQAYILAAPKLMSEGARMGQVAGRKAGKNAVKRLATRIEDEGLVVVEDPSLLSRLLDALQ
ncbi:DUF2059 domain-containing protein [Rhodobacteraceae bacterium M382]|nr:DUF2059 domain-containing protein [Rhodobacteraceae bacterium M382]